MGFQSVYAQSLVLDFSKGLKKECPSISNNLTKKFLIQILKNKGSLDCSDESISQIYLGKCGDTFDCEKSIALFRDLKNKYSGNVIGGE